MRHLWGLVAFVAVLQAGDAASTEPLAAGDVISYAERGCSATEVRESSRSIASDASLLTAVVDERQAPLGAAL